ncbi:DUF6557 family protein [Bradyrhizobium sp. AS23.2]|uniref:DUF6557 family protein n=1 Tax=Bradyrhizobium sp. AS23.2 TaxID=1680155 RepID=UPI00093E6AB4|nr:DUF6557 family protein [Bradyrhizobium sp. AS23.2]OKO83065.1 hypothetical protein AC630_12250 [Bradyrhizobium sp. AS23.2]
MTVGDLFASLDRDAVIGELERQSPPAGSEPGGARRSLGRDRRPEAAFDGICLPSRSGAARARTQLHRLSGTIEGGEDLLAIEFVDWRQWLSMPLVLGTGMADAPPSTVLAAILNEMTFAGYSNLQATGN